MILENKNKPGLYIKKVSKLLVLLVIIGFISTLYSMPFTDVPKNHWAYDAIKELTERGIIEGYDGKASSEFKGDRILTRYEFAQSLMRTIKKLEAEFGVTKATGTIDEVNVNEVLSKSQLKGEDIDLLKKLIKEFQKELADMNLRLNEVETKQRNMAVSQPKTSLYISIGAAILSILALIISIAK